MCQNFHLRKSPNVLKSVIMTSRKKVEDTVLSKKIKHLGSTLMLHSLIIFLLGMISISFLTPLNTKALFASNEVDAYELIVDGERWFILDDVKQISKALDQFKSRMTPVVGENVKILSVEFAQEVEIVPVRVMKSDLSLIDNLNRKLNYEIQSQDNYIVQKGDSAWAIANTLGISLEEIQQLNPSVQLEILQPNDQLIISAVKHYLDVKVTLESIAEETIHYDTKTNSDPNLAKNTKKVIKQGSDGLKEVVYIYEYVNGVEKSYSIISETVLIEPISAEVTIGSKPVTVRSSGTNFGVTTGRLSSDFGWRIHPITGKRSFHDGIDIANQVGTAINAYADGTVTKTAWNDSYGNFIIIDHGGGLETYYIHLSGIEVSVGDNVSTGQLIVGLLNGSLRQMGSTGSSTGSHLQFEVRLNGTPQNPWDYLK
jgi:murein DD-endopeptidase MepM/ murein hydrolase activator NlpD